MKIYYLLFFLLVLGCQNAAVDSSVDKPATDNSAVDKENIIETLKLETKYFCERKLKEWQAQWSQQPIVSKLYGGNMDFEYMDNWEGINQFVVDHIADNPAPIPLPKTNFDFDIHLYGQTAWVFYTKNVDESKVKETRFMVKEGEKWKIARMETVY